MDKEYVEQRTIFETVIGSRAYGIHTPESDWDKAGVFIPGEEYYLGMDRCDQFQGYEDDHTTYELRKIVNLILDNNPNCLDLLCSPEHCVTKNTKFWKIFQDNSHLFISKKCRYTFMGYSIAQLKRIRTHRKFLLNPPTHKPTREEFGLKEHSIFPTASIRSVLRNSLDLINENDKPNFLNELDSIYRDYVSPLLAKYVIDSEKSLAIGRLSESIDNQTNSLLSASPFIKEEFIIEAKKEVAYHEAEREYQQWKEWSKTRNEKRAVLEKKFGFDTKHAAHLVRLIRMGKEILETGKVNVDRTNIDAEELKSIRNGAWTYEQVEEYANNWDKKMGELYQTSTLRKSPDVSKVKEICVEVVKEFLFEGK